MHYFTFHLNVKLYHITGEAVVESWLTIALAIGGCLTGGLELMRGVLVSPGPSTGRHILAMSVGPLEASCFDFDGERTPYIDRYFRYSDTRFPRARSQARLVSVKTPEL